MSINPKSVQKSEIECKKVKSEAYHLLLVKLSAKKWNWVQNGEIKMIDNSYFELGQTNGGQKLNKDWNSLSKFQYNYLITKQSAKLNNNY